MTYLPLGDTDVCLLCSLIPGAVGAEVEQEEGPSTNRVTGLCSRGILGSFRARLVPEQDRVRRNRDVLVVLDTSIDFMNMAQFNVVNSSPDARSCPKRVYMYNPAGCRPEYVQWNASLFPFFFFLSVFQPIHGLGITYN